MRKGGLARSVAALVVFLIAATPSYASRGDCGQPLSDGDAPLASDCLYVLQVAVGASECKRRCVCDTDASGRILAGDALRCLLATVDQPDTLACECPAERFPCTTGRIRTLAGSKVDAGWTGIGHDQVVPPGFGSVFLIDGRCEDGKACLEDSECDSGACEPSCDCLEDFTCSIRGEPKVSTCSVSGEPCSVSSDCSFSDGRCGSEVLSDEGRCLTSLAPCRSSSDCPFSCELMVGPPLPSSVGGTPTCTVTILTEVPSGEIDLRSGRATWDSRLRTRLFPNGTTERPCPVCEGVGGGPLRLGEQGLCAGGQRPGEACRADAVHPYFGASSYDCAPRLDSAVSGIGLTTLPRVTTESTSTTALLPCTGFGFTDNPKNGTGVCTDEFSACTSNADCRRCDGQPGEVCSSNADCDGTCLEAPDSAITCGYWCHCGFCTEDGVQDPDAPCRRDGDCSGGATCQVGQGVPTQPTAPQVQPNNCNSTVCGLDGPDFCAETFQGSCSGAPYRPCIPNGNDVCGQNDVGMCLLQFRGCFGPSIDRFGRRGDRAVPRCANSLLACPGGTECEANEPCVEEVVQAAMVDIGCVGASASPATNSATGTTGPHTLELEVAIELCRCGDGVVGCAEHCDPGPPLNDQDCDARCRRP